VIFLIELKVLGYDIKGPLLSLLRQRIGLKFTRKYSTEEGEVCILIGESYAFRTGSDLTSTVILEFIHNSEVIITIIASGGAEGICKVDWGAQGANERSIADSINLLANQNDWVVKHVQKKTQFHPL